MLVQGFAELLGEARTDEGVLPKLRPVLPDVPVSETMNRSCGE